MGHRPIRINPWLPPALLGWFAAMLFLWGLTPEPLFVRPFSTVLEAADGRLLAARTARDGQWRFPLEGEFSEKLLWSVLTYEDEGFFHHPGFSSRALVRAAWQNISRQKIVSGGSTLSMQVVRLSRNNPPRTFWEKASEILGAVSLELRFSKDQILDAYLHHAPMGGNVVGLEAASWRYFGRRPRDLTWAQAATLAVLPNSPTLIRLDRGRELLQQKRDFLLRKLHQRGHLDGDSLTLALAEPLPDSPYPLPRHARHLLEGQKNGPRLKTAIDFDLQVRAEQVAARHLDQLANDDVKNIAALILETRTDRVLAYIGNGPDSSDPEMSRSVDILRANRSTGSLLKPFLYALSVQEGVIAPRQLLPDYPIRWGDFSPENYNKKYEGAIPADQALARSRNIPAAWLLKEYGLTKFTQQLQHWGLSTLFRRPEEYGLPLIIGASEARAVELARLFTALGRTALPPEEQGLPGLEKIGRAAAWLTLQALAQSVRPGEDRAWQQFGSGRRVAWKTGTSQGWRDAWSVGITPEYTVLVWAGNASGYGRPTVQGFSAAAPIMFDLFRLLPPTTWFPEPANDLEARLVSEDCGYPAGPDTPRTRYDLFPKDAPLPPLDPYSRTVHLDALGRLADSRVETPDRLRAVRWFVLPPIMEWYYKDISASYRPLPPPHPDLPRQPKNHVGIVYPVENARLFLPIDIDGKPGKLIIQAAYSSQGVLFWHLDGEYLGETQTFHQMEIRPDQGPHLLTLVSQEGDFTERRFHILSRH